jgi:hypothetical protein
MLVREGEAETAATMSLDWSQGSLREGMRCFERGDFFEAHEHWEEVWLAAQEPEKTFLQALIQVAASFYHLQRGNTVGAVSLLRGALGRLDLYPESFAGIAVASLRMLVPAWIEAIEGAAHGLAPALIPRIQQITRIDS